MLTGIHRQSLRRVQTGMLCELRLPIESSLHTSLSGNVRTKRQLSSYKPPTLLYLHSWVHRRSVQILDPCPGSCGAGAQCSVINHTPICSCPEGYTGDPFSYCQPKPPALPEPVVVDKCNPSPCGTNAQCDDGVCTCLPEYQGDPYRGCRPECVLSSDCPRDKACIRNKCADPCPGTCGTNAECSVMNHIPICTCLQGFIGNAFLVCSLVPAEILPEHLTPCTPSPCGANAQCKEQNGAGSCTCFPDYIGNPYEGCRPECVLNSDCPYNKACIRNKCQDPCPGTCGQNADCQVVNHLPFCTCRPGYTGDPFKFCNVPPQEPVRDETPVNPCHPSPCGPNSQCREVNGQAKCKDPCPGSCGVNADCRVVSHTPNCVCLSGFEGNPFIQCQQRVEVIPLERPTPCVPSPCGANAECREHNGAGSCICITDHIGNPYEGCRPECTLNSDCPSNKACIRNKCNDPCPGTCGQNAECQVINHLPSCTCISGYTGDPFRFCNVIPPIEPVETEPCQPNPCGPNSQCREVNSQAVCSCLPEYTGSPPGCRPECVVSSECAQKQGLRQSKMRRSMSRNLRSKRRVSTPIAEPPAPITNPCIPSPCGSNSQCRDVGGSPSCSCLPNYIGAPPNCRPECTINSECQSNLACIREKCVDPCPGSCGALALCSVINHTPVCTCPEGYTGDPFSYCQVKPPEVKPPAPDPCNPSPCGSNAQCDDGTCTCLPEYQGDPYRGCRPECVLNSDCSRELACIRNKCKDPCPGTCGQNAQCAVINHIPTCSCDEGFRGNAFVLCTRIPEETPKNPCTPSPCGPNSQCREINGQAVCSCVPGFIGSPPTCRPECVTSAECSLNQACINQICIDPCPGTPPTCRPECVTSTECPLDRACLNQKCIDPCPGTCGINGRCQVVNHNPICSCPTRYTGDPFIRCTQVVEPPSIPEKPCQPSPCGPNAQCREVNGSPSCSCLPEFTEGTYAVCECLPEYHGNPYESCRPECLTNADCSMNRACITNKCQDPCPGTCGVNALCSVANHIPVCSCPEKYEGDAFRLCIPVT
ncbi:hypothetical protein NQ318_004707, partial [Aromia moschata]